MNLLSRLNWALVLSLLCAPVASAHEYWIQPTATEYAAGATISADLRVGENMRGNTLAYSDQAIRQIGVVLGGVPAQLKPRMGDRPAIVIPDAPEGMHVIGVETNANKVHYASFDKFANFVDSHGMSYAKAQHDERGLPRENFSEGYFRFAKALVAVGAGEGSDMPLGFALELVALSNPFNGDGPTRFVLTFQNKPLADHPVDVFFRAPGETGDAAKTVLTTDSNGVVEVPSDPGRYLINAVRLEPPSERLAQSLDVVWISLWASTTYSLN